RRRAGMARALRPVCQIRVSAAALGQRGADRVVDQRAVESGLRRASTTTSVEARPSRSVVNGAYRDATNQVDQCRSEQPTPVQELRQVQSPSRSCRGRTTYCYSKRSRQPQGQTARSGSQQSCQTLDHSPALLECCTPTPCET